MTPPGTARRSLDDALEAFERARQSDAGARIEDFLPPPTDPARRSALEELVRIDLECAWRQKVERHVESYAAAFPELAPLSVDLIAWEYSVRQQWGDRPGHGEYARRFPTQSARLQQELLRLDSQLRAEFQPAPLRSPASVAGPTAAATPASARVAVTAASLVDAIRQCELLTATQLETLAGDLSKRIPEAQALAAELLRRGWLTPYQVNRLLQGRAADLLFDSYIVLERLGEGGAGQVFKARHRQLNRVVALKVIRKELLADPEVLSRFGREAQILSRLDHPNIVHAYDAGPAAGTHILVMEFIEGIDLARLVKERGPLPVAQACDAIRQAALGLQHAHEKGLVHRDIKPPNLVVSGGMASGGGPFTVKLLDLGLARLRRSGLPDMHSLVTPTGSTLMGTPDFMAPEQAVDFHTADIRADIYSLGCTLFYLLAGAPPFPGGSLAEKLLRHQQREPPPLEVSPALTSVLHKMLAKQPGDRYQTPADVAAALRPFAEGAVVVEPRIWRGRRRAVIAAAGVLLLGVVAALLFSLGTPSEPTTPQPGAAPLDRLQRDAIPDALREDLPKETIAVLGDPNAATETATPRLAFSPNGRLLAVSVGTAIWLYDLGAAGGPRKTVLGTA